MNASLCVRELLILTFCWKEKQGQTRRRWLPNRERGITWIIRLSTKLEKEIMRLSYASLTTYENVYEIPHRCEEDEKTAETCIGDGSCPPGAASLRCHPKPLTDGNLPPLPNLPRIDRAMMPASKSGSQLRLLIVNPSGSDQFILQEALARWHKEGIFDGCN
jgi:hypothetical protein